MARTLNHLPLHLAMRLVLDDIVCSNALPDWGSVITINYSDREAQLQDRISRYLAGSVPDPAFSILVPKRSGEKKNWIVPSINDQMIVQACISTFADELDSKCLDGSVYSYRYNRQPDILGLVEDQVGAWARFQDETKRRCAGNDCILQIDLQDTFGSIDRARFLAFLGRFGDGATVELLKLLLNSFSQEKGLPLMNNSIFFAGNAYLSEVDRIVRQHATDFVRFVDDYRIFGKSGEALERTYRAVAADLGAMGFTINARKVRLGSTDEYLELVDAKNGAGDGQYISSTLLRKLASDHQIVEMVKTIVGNPDAYLNEGFGRFQFGVIRRHRFNEAVADQTSASVPNIWESAEDKGNLIARFADLLDFYANDPTETWRTLWLLYVGMDFASRGDSFRRWETSVNRLKTAAKIEPVVRLWANARTAKPPADVEQLHALNYVESGTRFIGGTS